MTVLTVFGAPEGHVSRLIAQRARETGGAVLHVARDDARMARVAEALSFFAPELEVVRFPAWDCLPYDRVSPHPVLPLLLRPFSGNPSAYTRLLLAPPPKINAWPAPYVPCHVSSHFISEPLAKFAPITLPPTPPGSTKASTLL